MCDISLDESIRSIAFDGRHEVVYGLDAEDNIYRYDFPELYSLEQPPCPRSCFAVEGNGLSH